MPNARRRLAAVSCAKCMFVEWRDAVCDEQHCFAVDQRRNVLLNYDSTHVNVLGALYYARLIREMFEEWKMTGVTQLEGRHSRRRLPFSLF